MRRFILSILLSIPVAVHGQVTIEECYENARQNYPLVRQYGLIASAESYDLQNASRGYLPRLGISGQATYQTDVTNIPISVPGFTIPTLRKDQYKIVAELEQIIWDGGAIKASKENIRAGADIDRAQFEVDMYELRQRINNLFFGILLLDERLRLNNVFISDLMINEGRVESYIENGIANGADMDAVQVEILSAGQTSTELKSMRNAYIRMLSLLTGEDYNENTEFLRPEYVVEDIMPRGNRRPEMDLFDAMSARYAAGRTGIKASNRPRFGVFIQGGYGNPGLDMLKDKFTTFALGGVRLTWNFGSMYTRRNDLRKIDTGISNIEVQRETFLFNTDLQRDQLLAEYWKFMEVMDSDDAIIELRGNILRSSEAKLENGTISFTDLMRDMHSLQNARINKAIHQTEKLQSIYNIKNLTNN